MDLFDCGNLDQMHLVLILYMLHSRQQIKKEGTRPRFCQIMGIWRRIHFCLYLFPEMHLNSMHTYTLTEEESNLKEHEFLGLDDVIGDFRCARGFGSR